MKVSNIPEEALTALQKTKLFSGLTQQQLQDLQPLVRVVDFEAGATIIEENDLPTDLYVIWHGKVEILKTPNDFEQKVLISTLDAGETIGELGLLDELPRSAHVKAVAPTRLLAMSIANLKDLHNGPSPGQLVFQEVMQLAQKIQERANEQPTYLTLVSNLATVLSSRMRITTQLTAEALKKELQYTKDRLAIGSFMVHVFLVIAIYLYAFKFVEHVVKDSASTSLISIPLIIFFAIAVISLMKNSSYPMSFYGITFKNWRQAVWEGIVFSIPWILGIAIIKWLLIHLVPDLHHLSLVQLNMGARMVDENHYFALRIALLLGYLIFTPLQELICRGGLQSSLQEFLIGRHKILFSVLMSNIFFSITHLFISFPLAMIVLLPGFFWGWMYSRHRTLIGVSISHLLIGGMAFFVFDINSILQAGRYF